MKKILALFLCILFIFAGCSSKNDTEKSTIKDSVVEGYVGEGTKTALRVLINSNAFLVENVFVKNHLPVDADKSVTNENGTFAPVVSDKILTYKDLENAVNSTYTKDVAEKLLGEKRYFEIDGKLYFDMKYDKESDYNLDWSEFEAEFSAIDENSYSIEITVRNAKGRKTVVNASAVTADGSIRLDNIYS